MTSPKATSLFFILMASASIFSGVAHAQLNKHDASIARHPYAVPIIDNPASSVGSARSLKDELDGGGSAASAPVSDMAAPGAVRPLQMPGTPAPMMTPLKVGNAAPNFVLPRVSGGSMNLAGLLSKGPTLVLFIRGTDSPYSLQQLQLLQKNMPQFNQLGVAVTAITPEPIDRLQAAQAKYNFSFDILQDPGAGVARQFGVLQITEPTPSLFSIDQSGRIVAVQTRPTQQAVFNLTQATLPFRMASNNTTGTMPIPTPVPAQPQAAPVLPEAAPVTTRQPLAQIDTEASAAAMAPAPSVDTQMNNIMAAPTIPAAPSAPMLQPLPEAAMAAPPSSAPPAASAPAMPPAITLPEAAPMPAVPSPRVNLVLPPSHPDYNTARAINALAI